MLCIQHPHARSPGLAPSQDGAPPCAAVLTRHSCLSEPWGTETARKPISPERTSVCSDLGLEGQRGIPSSIGRPTSRSQPGKGQARTSLWGHLSKPLAPSGMESSSRPRCPGCGSHGHVHGAPDRPSARGPTPGDLEHSNGSFIISTTHHL